MRPPIRALPAILLVPLLGTGGPPASRAPAVPTPLAIVDVHVVDVREGRVRPHRTVVIDGGRIRSVEADGRGIDVLKVYHRLSPEAFVWFVDEARERGLDAAGHIPLRMTSEAASEAGLRSLEHARDFLFDCFPGTAEFRATTRSLNPPVEVMRSMVEDHDPARCSEIFETFVENGTWYVPTHVTRRMDAYADDPDFRDDPRRRYLPAFVWQEWQADADRMVALDPSPEGRRVMRGFYETGLEITGAAHAASSRRSPCTNPPERQTQRISIWVPGGSQVEELDCASSA